MSFPLVRSVLQILSTKDEVRNAVSTIRCNLGFVSACRMLIMREPCELAGRSKNVWESPNGCLSFSFTTQMEDGRAVPLVQYVVSLAVTEAIKDICDKNVSDCNFF